MALAKVLIVTFEPIPAPDGKSVRIDSILRSLQGRYEVDLLAPKIGDVPHIEIRSSARLLRVPLGAGHLHAQVERFARAVRRQLQSDEYRIVHLCDPRVAGPACEMAAERGFKLVFEPLGVPVLDLERAFPGLARNAELVGRLRASEAMCLAAADAVVVGTTFASAAVSALQPDANVVVLPGGVDLAAFHPSGGIDGTVAEPVSSPAGHERIAYVGELAPWQGMGTLLRAAREVLRARPSVRFTLTGPGRPEHLQALASLARRLEIESSIELGPSIAYGHVPQRLAEADICVVSGELDARARRFGPFAQKAVEIMGSERALVVSRLPANEEVVSPGEASFFAPGDASELAVRLLDACAHPDARAAQARRGYEAVRARYSLPAFRDRLLAFYTLLLEDGSRVDPAPRQEPGV